MSQQTKNTMKKIYLEKIVLNMGVGKSGDAIEVAKNALQQISGKKPSSRNAKETQRDWGVRKGEPIGASVTIRNDEAKGNEVKAKSFDNFGNYSFGMKEHIDIRGVKYDPQIGILGLDISITLSRPGHNIRFRSKHKSKIGKSHIITKKEAQDFLTEEFGIQVV